MPGAVLQAAGLYFRCLGAVLARACVITAIVGAFTVVTWGLLVFATRDVTAATVFGDTLPYSEDSEVYGQSASMMWAKGKLVFTGTVDGLITTLLHYATLLVLWHLAKPMTFAVWVYGVFIPVTVLYNIILQFFFESLPRTWENAWPNMKSYAKLCLSVHLLGAAATYDLLGYAFSTDPL
ncbi:hypothetical protein HK101_002549 [Irineochytrium annulatum]|nr:hypothetical protein HK101_002549 [Irineochytrium annulatum]